MTIITAFALGIAVGAVVATVLCAAWAYDAMREE